MWASLMAIALLMWNILPKLSTCCSINGAVWNCCNQGLLSLPNNLQKASIANFCNNNIRTIGDSDMMFDCFIIELDLSSNHMESISDYAFSNAVNLEILDLSNNDLTKLTEKHFCHNIKLRSLLLNDNRLSHVDSRAFFNSQNLRELNLGNNNISMLDNLLFSRNNELVILDLHNNNIISIQEGTFDSLVFLERLSLGRNCLMTSYSNGRSRSGEINSNTFARLRNLLYLDLKDSNIKRLPRDMITENSKLKLLDLSGNDLEFNDECFLYSASLRALYLQNLKTNVTSLDNLSCLIKLRIVWISGENTNCTYLQALKHNSNVSYTMNCKTTKGDSGWNAGQKECPIIDPSSSSRPYLSVRLFILCSCTPLMIYFT